MTTQTTQPLALAIANEAGYSPAKLQLIKDTIARGTTDDELALFLYTAQRSGLDPLARQIYCIKRWDAQLGREVASTQTSIDGLRLIADRTGRYAPGRAPTFEYNPKGTLVSATAYVMKYVRGTWHEVAATAYYDEYVQRKKDGSPTQMWANKPRIMLGKCAESLALRRAFPAEMSGIYTSDEMGDTAPASAPVVVRPSYVPTAADLDAEAADALAFHEAHPDDGREGASLPTENAADARAEYARLFAKALDLGIELTKDGKALPPHMPVKATEAQVNAAVEYVRGLVLQAEDMQAA